MIISALDRPARPEAQFIEYFIVRGSGRFIGNEDKASRNKNGCKAVLPKETFQNGNSKHALPPIWRANRIVLAGS
ncbi:hypothetical protein [Rhizobium rhizogenes]|uniref:hypothetical protein n=1 Tax=Rhizobium rhizogenes TaxID=359 RepID=UPI003F4F8876